MVALANSSAWYPVIHSFTHSLIYSNKHSLEFIVSVGPCKDRTMTTAAPQDCSLDVGRQGGILEEASTPRPKGGVREMLGKDGEGCCRWREQPVQRPEDKF